MKNNKFELKRQEVLVAREEMLSNVDNVNNVDFLSYELGFEKLFESAMFALLSDPKDMFYGNFLINAERNYSYVIPSPLSVQITSRKIILLINPLIFPLYTLEDMHGLFKHEVIHLISSHYQSVFTLESIYPKVVPLLASDLIANFILSKEGHNIPKCLITVERFNTHFNENIEITDKTGIVEVSKTIMELSKSNTKLKDFIDFNNGGDKEIIKELLDSFLQTAGYGDSMGFGEDTDLCDMSIDFESFSEEDQKLFMDVFAGLAGDMELGLITDMLKHITIDSISQSRGKFPGGLSSMIQILTAPPIITWEEELARFIGSLKAGQKPTQFRRDRRQPMRLDLKGKLPDKEIDLVVAIDTSGSMSNKVISDCMTEIVAITKLMKTRIRIVECDAKIGKVYEATNPADVQPEVSGRGGTSFSPVFKWMEENASRDTVLIYLTDGYGESAIDKDINIMHQGTIWVLTDKKEDLSITDLRNSKVLSFTNK